MEIAIGQPFELPIVGLPPEAARLIMLWISPGSFHMGMYNSEPNWTPEDGPPFEMTLSLGYWLGQYLVTQAQWQAIMEDNPSYFRQSNKNCPVENINWLQALSFCQKLNTLFAKALPQKYSFCLPTEGQWEYACRAGTQTRYCNGNSIDALSEVAWHKENSGGHPHPVGKKSPNNWGLYDMHGNVAEWCYDSPSDYPSLPTLDWVGKGDDRIKNIRGGSWGTTPSDASFYCGGRVYTSKSIARAWFGFRLCLGFTLN